MLRDALEVGRVVLPVAAFRSLKGILNLGGGGGEVGAVTTPWTKESRDKSLS